MSPFSDKIIEWYLLNKRDLPWRNTKNPYFIWLSEIILQQTRVDQGMAYYIKFVKAFPTVTHLAKADNEKVMKLWQGLGYYSRARNLHISAKMIVDNFDGEFPTNYEDVISLKGVGPYAAAAITSFAFDLPYAVVDGNVYRVLSRVFGVDTPIDSTEGKKQFKELADELLNKESAANHNQAIMEFGAMQCKPAKPLCEDCVLSYICVAKEKGLIVDLPVKVKKIKIRNRYFNYVVIRNGDDVVMNKRGKGDIWEDLYDFPCIELGADFSDEQFLKSDEWGAFSSKSDFKILSFSKTYKHILTHQRIYARFIEIESLSRTSFLLKKTKKINLNSVGEYAVPRLVDKYLKDCNYID